MQVWDTTRLAANEDEGICPLRGSQAGICSSELKSDGRAAISILLLKTYLRGWTPQQQRLMDAFKDDVHRQCGPCRQRSCPQGRDNFLEEMVTWPARSREEHFEQGENIFLLAIANLAVVEKAGVNHGDLLIPVAGWDCREMITGQPEL